MSELDDFLIWFNTRLYDAEVAMHNGNAAPRLEIWSQTDPVTVFGAWMSARNAAEVTALFRRLEDTFADCTSFTNELIVADVRGDQAYTVCHEHTSATVNGVTRSYTLRATQLFRREGRHYSWTTTDGGSSMPGTSSTKRSRTRVSRSAMMRRTVASSWPPGSSTGQSTYFTPGT